MISWCRIKARELKKREGRSTLWLSQKTGYSEQTIRAYLSLKTKKQPSQAFIIAFANAFNAEPQEVGTPEEREVA